MKRFAFCIAVLCFAAAVSARAEEGWVELFNGQDLTGWKATENTDSWSVEDGAIVCHGERSHLYYVEDDRPFKNFIFETKVMTKPKSNSGIYFHTRVQEGGWPKYGFEVQVNNTHADPKKTGSLYDVKNVLEIPAKDDEWFTETIVVEGSHIVVKVNDEVVMDFTEEPDRKPGKDFTRKTDQGTFALQAHDPISKVYFKEIRVKRLPD